MVIPVVEKLNKKKKPKKINIKEENIPDILKKQNSWVCWQWLWAESKKTGKGKWTKPPCDTDGYTISHNDSKLSYKEVLQAYQDNKDIAGIGFSLRKEDKFCGIDFDNVLNEDGKPNKRLKKAMKLLKGAYIERSPGGQGVRVFGIGKPENRASKGSREIEIYKSNRYLTITGHKISKSNRLINIEKACKKISKKIYKEEALKNKIDTKKGLEVHENSNPLIVTIRSYFPYFNADIRDDCILVGQVIHYEMDGSVDGFNLWESFNGQTSAGNFFTDASHEWNSFNKKKKGEAVTLGSFRHRKKEIEEGVEIEECPNLYVNTLESIEKSNVKKVNNIMEPWFMKDSVNMVHAKRGLGKTHFSIGISMALAAGSKFLKWNVKEPKKVLYIDGEMPFPLLKQFIEDQKNAMRGKCPKKGMLNFITIDKQKDGLFPSLSEESGRFAVENVIEKLKPEVVIFDSLSTCFKINEYAGDYWSDIQDWLISLRSKGIDILLVHHDNKSGKAQSGRVDKEHILNCVIHLKEPAGLEKGKSARFEIEYTKSRHFWGKDAMPFEARLAPKVDGDGNASEHSIWQTEDSGASTFDTVVQMFKEKITAIDIAAALDISKAMITRYKKKALISGVLKETDINMRRRSNTKK